MYKELEQIKELLGDSKNSRNYITLTIIKEIEEIKSSIVTLEKMIDEMRFQE